MEQNDQAPLSVGTTLSRLFLAMPREEWSYEQAECFVAAWREVDLPSPVLTETSRRILALWIADVQGVSERLGIALSDDGILRIKRAACTVRVAEK